MKTCGIAALAVTLAGFAPASNAATITYRFPGFGSGQIVSIPFTGPYFPSIAFTDQFFEFTFLGDTANVTETLFNGETFYGNSVSGATFQLGSVSGLLTTNANQVLVNQNGPYSRVMFAQAQLPPELLTADSLFDPVFESYDLKTTYPLTLAGPNFGEPIFVSAHGVDGLIEFSNVTVAAFEASVAAPEPQSWAMLAIGFAGLSALAISRSRKPVLAG